MQSDRIPVPGGEIATYSYGKPGRTPLVVCHGGPGFAHNYLTPFAALARERQVILYDQLGCGQSSRPSDAGLYTTSRAVDELAALVEHLQLGNVHLLGHSWGTILALEYWKRFPSRVSSLVMGSPCLSLPRWKADTEKLVSKLSLTHQNAVRQARTTGDFSSASFQAALEEFDRRFLRGMESDSIELFQSKQAAGSLVYTTMWGICEFICSGTLQSYNTESELHGLRVPTFYYCGRYDEATPRSTAAYAMATPSSTLRVYRRSAHHPHLTERDRNLNDVDDFLSQVETGGFRPMPRLGIRLRGLVG